MNGGDRYKALDFKDNDSVPAQTCSMVPRVVNSLGLNMDPLSLKKPVDRGVHTEIRVPVPLPQDKSPCESPLLYFLEAGSISLL